MTIPTCAVKGIIVKDDKFLLLQRNPKTRDKDNWDLPGGLVETHEEEESALTREINEELGLEVAITKKAGKWSFHRPLDSKQVNVQNYICKIQSGSIKLSEEHISYKWVSVEEIRKFPVKDDSLYVSLENTFK